MPPVPPAGRPADLPPPPGTIIHVPDTPRERGLTWRALLIALTGVVIIAGYSDISDNVVHAGPGLASTQLPYLPMLLVLLAGVVWNPLVGRLNERWRLRTRELSVALILMLSVSWIAGVGQLKSLPSALVLPWVQQGSHAAWQQEHTLSYLPARAVPLQHNAHDPRYERVFRDANIGITPAHGAVVSWSQVPWQAWIPALGCWVPLLFLIALALFALAVLLHRQWSKHEMLGYPLATVMASVLPGPGGVLPPLMRSPLFWIGTAPPLLINGINWGSMITHGHYFPWIQFFFFLTDDLGKIFPLLLKAGYNGFGYFQFILVGISYFLPTEVSFSIATGYMVCMAVAIPVYLITGEPMPGNVGKNVVSGAFLGYGLMLLVIARTYLRSVLVRAIRPLRPDDPDPAGPWAARTLAVAVVACVVWLSTQFSMDWCIAAIYVVWMLLYFMVVMRIVSETGIPFFQSEMDWGMSMANVLGLPALGPQALVLINWLAPVVNRDNRNCLPPFAANALKLAEHTQVRIGRLVPWVLGAVVLSLVLGVVAKLWYSYAVGIQGEGLGAPTGMSIDNATKQLAMLRENDQLSIASAAHGLGHLALIPQNVGHARELVFTAMGILGVWATSFARYRFAWFPFHPLIFLMWETWPSKFLWYSFLLGWAAKASIVRFGGPRGYQVAKPFFLGLILGEVFMAGFVIVFQLIWYLITGTTPGSGMFTG